MSQSDLPIWAQDRAREWLESLGGRLEGPGPIGEAYGWLEVSDESAARLAALLVDVSLSGPTPDAGTILEAAQHRDDAAKALLKAQLAEVRRVVEEVRDKWAAFHTVCPAVASEILARLEKL